MKLDVVELENGITNVAVAGRMDVQGTLAIDKQFDEIANRHMKVVVDLSSVDFLASLGIRTLVSGCKTLANKGGNMVILSPQANVEKVLRTSGIDTVIPIVQDMAAATLILNR